MALRFNVPGMGPKEISVLVLDYNGTIADRGHLLPGVAERLRRLAEELEIHVFTADTFGTVKAELSEALGMEMASGRIAVDIIPQATQRPGLDEGGAKLRMLEALGAVNCCAMGNGRNDVAMLSAAELSFCILGREGCFPGALNAAQILCRDILEALDMLTETQCCIATLRI